MNLKKGICMVLVLASMMMVFAGCNGNKNPESSQDSSAGEVSGASENSDVSNSDGSEGQGDYKTPDGVEVADDATKSLIQEFSSGEVYEKLKGGFVAELAGGSEEKMPTYNLKDNSGKYIGSVVINDGNVVQADVGNSDKGVVQTVPGKNEEGDPVMYYCYITNTDPARYEIGVVEGQSSYHSNYTGIRIEYNPQIRLEDGKYIVYVTDNGKEIGLCEVALLQEYGRDFIDLLFLDSLTMEQRLKYTVSQGEEGYVDYDFE